MNTDDLRAQHESLNRLISDSISASSGDALWDDVRAMRSSGGGIGHFVATVTGRDISYNICIYPFPNHERLPPFWTERPSLELLTQPRPIQGRVLQRFKAFSGQNTFYHRAVSSPLSKTELAALPAALSSVRMGDLSSGTLQIFDRADLALLPLNTKSLFICPLRVLASPSTFLFLRGGSPSKRLQICAASLVPTHFEMLLLNYALDNLLRAITQDIHAGTIVSKDELQKHFLDHLATMFLPVSIKRDGYEVAAASSLIAEVGMHPLKVEVGKDLTLSLLPPSVAMPGSTKRRLCSLDGMVEKYASLSRLLTSLYRQLETTLEASARAFEAEMSHQQHTIFNVLPTTQIDTALNCPTDQLSGDARALVEGAKRKLNLLETSLAIPLDRPLTHLDGIPGVCGLLRWLNTNLFSVGNPPAFRLPQDGRDIELRERMQKANAFSLFWNLWDNAAKNHPRNHSERYSVSVRWDGSFLLVTFKNAGTMPSEYVKYLLEKKAQWPGARQRKGLITLKSKLQALNWEIQRIGVDSGLTEITVAATGNIISNLP
jgi:hypothetical protein